MSTFLNQCNQLQSAELISRIRIAMYKVSTQIVGELGAEYSPSGKNKRHTLALQVLFGQHVTNFATAIVSSDSSINSESTDNELEAMVISIFNAMAGITSDDLV